MSEQQIIHKPFDSAFKTLVAACPQLLIPLINELFGTDFTANDKVVLMDSKQMKPVAMGKIATREVDSLFAINGERKMTFHVECQSSADDTMVARFWEYDALIAMRSAKISRDGVMDVEFPRSAVLYLRHNENTPDTLTIRLKRATSEPIVLCEIPVVKTQNTISTSCSKRNCCFCSRSTRSGTRRICANTTRTKANLRSCATIWRG